MKSIKSLSRSDDVDFSAKVRWRMKYDRNPLFIALQDKYKVREYASSKGVKTANLLYVTDRPETIPFGELPQKYLIKANHGWEWNILCFNSKLYLFGHGEELVNQDGTFLNMDSAAKYELSRSEAIQICKGWLSQRHSEDEWAYQHINPRIIVEELLVSKDNEALKDYRMFTFHGVVKAIDVKSAINKRNGEGIFFDPNCKEIKLTAYKVTRPDPLPEMPTSLGEMIDVAQILGEKIDFARIDLYDTTQGVILGEITIYPSAGKRATPTFCPVFNKWLGDQWKLRWAAVISAFCREVVSGIRSFGSCIVGKYRK